MREHVLQNQLAQKLPQTFIPPDIRWISSLSPRAESHSEFPGQMPKGGAEAGQHSHIAARAGQEAGHFGCLSQMLRLKSYNSIHSVFPILDWILREKKVIKGIFGIVG